MSNYTGWALGTAYAVQSVTADSTGSGSVDYLYDGLTADEWRSSSVGTTHWVLLTLPRAVWIGGLRLYLSTALNQWNSCVVYVSARPLAYGDDWGAAVFTGDLSPGSADAWNETTFAEAWGRYILIEITVASASVYAKEIDVYILSLVAPIDDDLPTDETLLASGTRFYIDVTDDSGNKYGPGPIISAHYWKSTKRVDRAGEFEFAMPLADEKADWVQHRYRVRCYAITGDGVQLVGSGIIDSIAERIDSGGNINLVVSGSDIMRELAWRTVEYLQLTTVSGSVTHAIACGLLAAYLPAGWTIEAADYPPNDDIYYFYAGESVLSAAITLAELTRVHVWMREDQTLTFTNEWDASGLRAIEAPQGASVDADNVCLISDLTVTAATHDLISRIVPYGAEIPGLDGSYVSLFNTTKSAPVGYTLSTADKYIKNDAIEAVYGRVESFEKYSDVSAASSATLDLESAANQLFDLALYDLQRRSQINTQYTLSLAHAPTVIEPMRTIRVVFRRRVAGRDVLSINADLYVMGATTMVDADGMRTVQLEVTTVDRWPQSDIDPIRSSAKSNLRIR